MGQAFGTILQTSGPCYIEFFQDFGRIAFRREIVRFGGDGSQVQLYSYPEHYSPENSTEPYPTPTSNVNTYSLEAIQPPHRKALLRRLYHIYRFATRFLDCVKASTAKVTIYRISAAPIGMTTHLMENGDVRIRTTDGDRVQISLSTEQERIGKRMFTVILPT